MEYDRHRHVLHEMKRLGAAIEHAGNRLIQEEIDFLNPAEARTASITARQSYGIEDITSLPGPVAGIRQDVEGGERRDPEEKSHAVRHRRCHSDQAALAVTNGIGSRHSRQKCSS
ncbi:MULTISPECIES: hypothetical protein [unclassified Amycolatopsis]|uniref:hypothetical protein n=1 Tax=Amycolatopsis TaxID=1813 RepID=UPI0012FB7F5D|nr:hypothetical protein [Amycolatopsis sp. ATCC 39116]